MSKGFIGVFTFSIVWYLIFTPTAAIAEEVAEEPAVEEIVEEAPAVEEDPATTWSVVDETGKVVNHIICTESVCGEDGKWAGQLPQNSPCPGCTLVHQTNEQHGYSSSGDTEVRYDSNTGTHTVTEKISAEGVVSEQTSIINKDATTTRDNAKITAREDSVEINVEIADGFVDSEGNLVTVEIPDVDNGVEFRYNGPRRAVENLESDVQQVIVEEQVEPSIAETITELAQRVVNFFSNLFGWGNNE